MVVERGWWKRKRGGKQLDSVKPLSRLWSETAFLFFFTLANKALCAPCAL